MRTKTKYISKLRNLSKYETFGQENAIITYKIPETNAREASLHFISTRKKSVSTRVQENIKQGSNCVVHKYR